MRTAAAPDGAGGAQGTLGLPAGVGSGLSNAEVARLRAVHGPNAIPAPRPPRVAVRVFRSLLDPLVLVLLAALALTLVTTDLTDAAVIGLVVLVNTTLAVRQEVSADRAVRALSSLVTPSATVTRDGRQQSVSVEDLVPGDLVHLRQGDLVPADAVLVSGTGVTVDESMLTGESEPVGKSPLSAQASAGPDAATPDDATLYAGTAVVRGRGTVRVTATGPASATGRIAALVVGTQQRRTPLQQRMARLSGQLAVAAVALCSLVFVIGLLRGEPVERMLLTGVSLIVAAVPESLPVVVTLSMALAARRMAARHAVVRNLAAVETLGSVTLLATDKTGTLTEGLMAVSSTWQPDGLLPQDLMAAVVLCNDAGDGVDGVRHDPTESALLATAASSGVDVAALRASRPRLSELPFDSRTKRMTTWHALRPTAKDEPPPPGWSPAPSGRGPRVLVVSKGAPEVMIRPEVLDDPPELVAEALERAGALAAAGERVLAVAAVEVATALPTGGVAPPLHLVGLVALRDLPRAAAADAVSQCLRAGIEVGLVTGDHPATAWAVARAVNIPTGSGPLALHEPAAPAPVDAVEVSRHRVIARATPADKLELISAWQHAGHVVAMLGDGVNDAPALHRADIGVAMGRRGTEVAREAADVILTDDNLGTVVAAVEEGRRVYANIRRFLLYGISGGAAEILLMLAGPAAGVPLPLLPAQILWVNLVTHSFAGAALGAEPLEDGAMVRGPRPPRQNALDGLWWRLLVLAATVATAALLGAVVAGDRLGPSTALLALGVGQLCVALALQSRTSRPLGRQRLVLPLTLAAAAVLLVAAVTVPPLSHLLGTYLPPPASWAWAAGSGLAAYAVARWVRPSSL
ncbi:cation-translocating P-type ATPase [Pedococcus ginsenosidimutans]|uniref:Cation-translocating P-type ATPase n=1 Tax=Pedococcus ginsenosidimutans TaxID=490570 RepID=A0ABP8YJ10_9MICO